MSEEQFEQFFDRYTKELKLLSIWILGSDSANNLSRIKGRLSLYLKDRIPYFSVTNTILNNPCTSIIILGLRAFKKQYKIELQEMKSKSLNL